MEIIKDSDSSITQPVTHDYGILLDEEFPTEPLDPSEVSDKYWDAFEIIKTFVPETAPIRGWEIAIRTSSISRQLTARCLKTLWRAGVIRRFLQIRFRMTRGQPGRSKVWYVINNVKDYAPPDISKLRRNKRGRGIRAITIPDEVVAQIRAYGSELTVEDIARKHNISIWYVEKLLAYEYRPTIQPKK